LANGALLAGHVEVGDRALYFGQLPGPSIHPRFGTLAIMQGGAPSQRFAALHRGPLEQRHVRIERHRLCAGSG